MKNIDTHIKSSRHKKIRLSSPELPEICEISSESENDEFPLSKDSNEPEEEEEEEEESSSTSIDSTPQRIVVKTKRKRHRCKHKVIENETRINYANQDERQKIRDHHRAHKRHHKRKDGQCRRRHEEAVKIKMEPLDDYHSSRHTQSSSQRRQVESRRRERVEEADPTNHTHSARHRHHREGGSSDRVRHHRRREDVSHRDRGETSRARRPSAERVNKNNKKSDGRTGGSRWKDDDDGDIDDNSAVANRPIKQEPVSEEEPNYEWGRKTDNPKDNKKVPEEGKAKPNFGLSGKLAEDTNTFNGVVIKYSEPPEARKPKRRWRFYPFKGDQGLPTLYIHRQSCYLIGRDRKVADIPIDHPSCSKQHAALQYRLVPYQRDDGTKGRRVRPYIIDLESANGTFVNNVKVDHKKYVELLEKDVVKFGYSSREYVLLHEHSKDDEMDDDVPANEEND